MWKVLIADDEPKIRRGLHAQLLRMGLPVEICGEAEDGETALVAAESLRPDILLVDINMPFLSGLEFIEKLRRTRSDVKIIVVTGYEDFTYLKKSLELSVHAYLLKPVDERELREALASAIEQLESERARNRHFEWAIAQLGRRRDFLREEFLRDAVTGQLTPDEIRDFRAYFDFPEPKRLYLMLIVARRAAEAEKPWQHLMLQYALTDALLPVTAHCRYTCLFSDDRSNMLILYDADEEMDEALVEAVKKAAGGEFGMIVQIETEPVPSLTMLERAYDVALERLSRTVKLSPVVEAARAYIAKNYSNADLSLSDAASALCINSSYLSRLMKQELGMSFAKYLTTVRISEAVSLMRAPGARVRLVSEQVGYSAANYFSTAFKKVMGISPAEYRTEEKTP